VFARNDLFRLIRQRSSGVSRQYFNAGAPLKSFMIVMFVFQFFSIIVTTLIMWAVV